MPRKSRAVSPTGVYHVMLRGINKGAIFMDDTDCRKFLKILGSVVSPVDADGVPLPPYCDIYAYCLMTNHIHLLIRESSESIGAVMKRIGVAYVAYFNRRHERLGPLFHDRFRSEPVADQSYFVTLLRYIHQNPIEAKIADSLGRYRWSSWHEYTGAKLNQYICAREMPFESMSWDEICQLVKDCNRTSETRCGIKQPKITDSDAKELVDRLCGGLNLREYSIKERKEIVRKAVALGVKKAQLSRLSGISYGAIDNYLKGKQKGDE